MKKFNSFIIFLIVLVIIPILTRQFLVTDAVIENKIESSELFQSVSLDIERVQLSKSIYYYMEMMGVFFDFLITLGIVIGLLKAFAFEYKSSEILNAISEAYIIILLGYLIKILYFILKNDFSIEHFESYQILSIADFYSYENTDKFKYLMLSSYNLFGLSAMVYLVYSIYNLTNRNLKISLTLALIAASMFFLIPLIGL
jgi:hypothetical protein